ncbi:hypothetical protein [Nocardioides ferulae]|nr:hypothetical protein [Nocardioides ferulae]
MNEHLTESAARHQIRDRIERASAPRVRQAPSRQRLAERLRRVADRLDG